MYKNYFFFRHLLICIICFLSCTGSTKYNQRLQSSNSKNDQKSIDPIIEVFNPNLSFIGEIQGKPVIININTSLDDDSINAILYYYNEIDPYETMIHLNGTRLKNEIILKSTKSIEVVGQIDSETLKGTYSYEHNSIAFILKKNKDYSNGNLFIVTDNKKNKMSLAGLDNKTPCQGKITKIANFKKQNNYFHLYYLVIPSTGVYKSRGNCGSGSETFLALIEYNSNSKKTKKEILEINSCYNSIESYTTNEDFIIDDLITSWKNDQKLVIRKMNLKKDSMQTIEIDIQKNNMINIY